MIHREIHDTVAVLRIEHGKVNALDTELFGELREALKAEEEAPSRAIVLTGTGKAFSAGVDLFRILSGGAAYIDAFVPVLSLGLQELFHFPKPVVAAVNGHAIAGGCILACCADYRLMVREGATIGVPELLVGVPFPAVALEIVRHGCAPQYLQEVVYTGQTYNTEDALRRGLIDEVADDATLLERAVKRAAKFGAVPPISFRMAKQMLRNPVRERYEANAALDAEVLSSWRDPDVHHVVRSYLQKTIGRS